MVLGIGKLTMSAHLPALVQSSLSSSSAYSKSLTAHTAFPQFHPPPTKSLNRAMKKKDGAAWLMHRMLILDGKRKQQIMATTQAKTGNDHPPDYIPQADFYKVEAILRPWRISHVASGLLKMGIRGVTVSDVRGLGAQGGSMERQAGSEFSEDSFVTKVKMEIVVSKDQVEAVIDTIIDQARTGEIGDGKIFVIPVADIIRVRTGERGLKAERMAGGRAELLSVPYQDVTNNK